MSPQDIRALQTALSSEDVQLLHFVSHGQFQSLAKRNQYCHLSPRPGRSGEWRSSWQWRIVLSAAGHDARSGATCRADVGM